MDERTRIMERVERGEISEAEGRRLLEAHAEAEARDAAVRVAAAARRRARRRRRWSAGLIAGTIGLAALTAVVAVIVAPGGSDAGSPRDGSRWAALDDGELDAAIERFEVALRRPGSATEYRALSAAYAERYERTGAEADLDRSTRNGDRADRLERRGAMRGTPVVFGLALALIVVAGLVASLMLVYNGLVAREERVDERWAQVETVLERRLDLVPPLVATVRGYAEHERETLVALTEARARALGTLEGSRGAAPTSPETVEAVGRTQREVAEGLGRLLALSERYPDLKASRNFLALQDQIEGTENRVAVERQRYNDAVRSYNQRLRAFPSNVVGGAFGFEPREYFEARQGAEDPVDVDFGSS